MQKTFSEFIAAFLKSTSNFDFFEKKEKNDLMYFQNYQLTKTCLHKCLKGSILEHRLTLNMLKGPETLQKYAREHFYHILSSISGKLRDKMSLLVICKILGLFANTLTADDKYSLRHKEDLPQTIQRQLSNKQKSFSEFIAAILKSTPNFAIRKKLEEKMTLIALVFSELQTENDVV